VLLLLQPHRLRMCQLLLKDKHVGSSREQRDSKQCLVNHFTRNIDVKQADVRSSS
jgi:hypothetical protein